MNIDSNSRRKRIVLVVLIILAVLLGLLVGAGAAILPHGQQIARGITVDGVALSGMAEQEAEAQLARHLTATTDQQLVLTAGDDTRTVRLRELGAQPDVKAAIGTALAVGREGSIISRLTDAGRARWKGLTLPLVYSVDDASIRTLLVNFGKRIDNPPVNASARWTGSGVAVTPGHVGAKLDVPASLKIIKDAVLGALTTGQSVPSPLKLVYRVKTPRITTEALSAIDTVLGTFSTSYATSSSNRANNIDTASETIDGTVLAPGEVFSFNGTVGPRSRATGYREAPVIVNGELDTGIGGGICQVSTTLYNAVLLANLGIVARSHHSLPSHYVKPGMDATVSYGALDFKFRNTMDTPVVVEMKTGGRRLTARILGKGPAPEVHIERSGIVTLSGRSRTVNDPTLPKGKRVVKEKGRSGIAVTVTRVVGSGEDAVREVLSRDRYMGEMRVIHIGTGPEKVATPNKDATKTPEKPAEDTGATSQD